MAQRFTFDPAGDRFTETLRVGVTIDAKRAVEDAARRTGQPVAGFVRTAVEQAIERNAGTRRETGR